MIPRFKPWYNREEIIAILNGREHAIETFEEQFANLVGSKYAVSFPYARSGLFTLINSLNIRDSEIIIPSYTCIALPSVIVASKNIPVFANISLSDYNIIINDVISRMTNKTSMVIPVHMYGYPVNVKKLREKIGKDIIIVEDAALSLLTKNVGKYGDATLYSLSIFKQLYTFEGGVVTTNNDDIYKKLKTYIRNHFKPYRYFNILKKIIQFYSSFVILNKYIFEMFDIWSQYTRESFYSKNLNLCKHHIPTDIFRKFSNFQANIGIAQMKKAVTINNKRKKIAEFYNEKLSKLEEITRPPLTSGASYSEYTIRVKNRNVFENKMREKNILINTLFSYSIPHLLPFKKYSKETFLNSIIASQSVVNLPSYPELYDNTESMEYIIQSIKECIKK